MIRYPKIDNLRYSKQCNCTNVFNTETVIEFSQITVVHTSHYYKAGKLGEEKVRQITPFECLVENSLAN